MNRGFRKNGMKVIAALMSVALLAGSVDVNTLYVQAQEQSADAVSNVEGQPDKVDLQKETADDENPNRTADGESQTDAGNPDSDNDGTQQGGVTSEEDDTSADDESRQDGAESDVDAEQPENEEDVEADSGKAMEDIVTDDDVTGPSVPFGVQVQADDDPKSEEPVRMGVSISGIAIADKIYDGKSSVCTGNVVVKAKIGEKGAEEDVTSSVKISYVIAGQTYGGDTYNETPDSINTKMPKDAGIYTLSVSVSGSDDKYIFEGSRDFSFAISQRQLTIAAEDKQIKITETPPDEYKYRILGLVSGESLTKEPERSCEPGKEPGQYTIEISGAYAGPNYMIVYQSGTLTRLGKELATISGFSIADKVYDGNQIKCVEPKVSGGGQELTYEYSIYGITENGDEYRIPELEEDSTGTPNGINADMPKDAGRYKLKIKVPSDNAAYKGNWQYDFEITRKKVTIEADNIIIQKGERIPKFTYKADGFVTGENPFADDSSEDGSGTDTGEKIREPKLTCNIKDTNTPGQYAIVPSDAFAGANYSIEYISGTLTILDEDAVTLSGIKMADGKNSKIYDGDSFAFDLAPEVRANGTLIPESDLEFEYSISGILADEDGTEYYSKGDMEDPDNRPKDSGQYILEVRVLRVTRSTEGNGGDLSDSGKETVTKEEIFRQDYPFSITPRPISITVKDIEIMAGDLLPVPAEDEEWYELGGLGFLEGEGFKTEPRFLCDLEDTEEPGTYPITASKADAGFNYAIAYKAGTLTITEREVVKVRRLVRIIQPNPVLNVKNGMPIDQIKLPELVYIKTREIREGEEASTGAVIEEWTHQVGVDWVRRPADGTSYSPGVKTPQQFKMHGIVVLPADVDAGEVSTTVEIEVSVREEITSRDKVKNPTASVPSGTAVRRGTRITLSCETEGAEIYYTLDDKNPPTKEKGLRYSYPITVSAYTVIWACAYKDGCPESDIVKFSYYIDNSIVIPGGDDDEDEPQVPAENIPSDGRIPTGLWVTEAAVSAYEYTGQAIKPVVRVYDYKTLLEEKKDYTISYKNNVNAADKNDPLKPPTITITGKGNYKGKIIRKFTITPKNIKDNDVTVDDITLAYNAKAPKPQKPSPVVMWKGKKLTKGKDYTVPDVSYTDVGMRTITVTGCGNYTGEKKFDFTITDGILMSGVTVSKIPDQVYTGKEIKPQPEVKYRGEPLSLNQNYALDWENNTEVGTATVIIKGVSGGRYVGTRKVTFKITAVGSLSKAKVELETGSKSYTGQEVKVGARSVTLKVGGVDRELVQNVDYEVTYQNNVKAGNATATFTGKGAYNGKIKKTFKITPQNIAEKEKVTVTLSTSYPYTQGGTRPEPKVSYARKTLKLGTDYTLSYKQNNAAGNIATVTVKGKGNFGGSKDLTFTVSQQDISKGGVKVDASDKVYQNKKNIYKTTVRLYDSNGKTLRAGSDYDKKFRYTYAKDVKNQDGKVLWTKGTEVSPEDIIPYGTEIQVEINAKGNNYSGTVTGTYRIVASNISKAQVTIPSQSYTGKAIEPDSQIYVSANGVKLTLGTDYEIAGYSNNVKKGTAKVVIHGLGNFGGTKTVSFKIVSKELAGK